MVFSFLHGDMGPFEIETPSDRVGDGGWQVSCAQGCSINKRSVPLSACKL